MDPANTLYLSTFYFEPAAIFGAYLAITAAVVAMVAPTRMASALVFVGAALLAGSKLQHVALPLLLGLTTLLLASAKHRSIGVIMILAGLLGGAVHWTDHARHTWISREAAMINRVDFALTVLLPNTSDRERVKHALDIDDRCASFEGKSVFEIPFPTRDVCRNNESWHAPTLWWLLLSDPAALGHALASIPGLLLPWRPPALGVVEGTDHGALPVVAASLDSVLGSSALGAGIVLMLPLLVFAGCIGKRASRQSLAFAGWCAVGSTGVAVVALFGDGHAEYQKHAHLCVSFALASLCIPTVRLLTSRGARAR
jgi:hypothetical protein